MQSIAMPLTNPYGTARPCVACEYFRGLIADGLHAVCMYGDRKQIQAQPESGCVYWVRATGADDEPIDGKMTEGDLPDSAD